jgi:hypothetical protein
MVPQRPVLSYDGQPAAGTSSTGRLIERNLPYSWKPWPWRPAGQGEILRGPCRRRATERRSAWAEYRFGGIIVIVGIVTMIFWSFWIGLIVTLIGLIAFGGFARGKWY